MEATPQATQRKITLESLDLVSARRPDVQVFNELLVQYPLPGRKQRGKVVPDNMVVVCDQKISAFGSYAIPLQPVRPFWVLEYVSKGNRRKDYVENLDKYDKDLRVPYYLLFEPDELEMTLYRHTGEQFSLVPPNAEGRCAIPELEIEVGLLDDWVRFWYQGELLPLPAELDRDLREAKQQLATETRRADAESRRADAESRRAEAETQRADSQTRRAEAEALRADSEKLAREAMEREVAQLRAQLKDVKN